VKKERIVNLYFHHTTGTREKTEVKDRNEFKFPLERGESNQKKKGIPGVKGLRQGKSVETIEQMKVKSHTLFPAIRRRRKTNQKKYLEQRKKKRGKTR